MILLNFAHPLALDHLAQVQALANQLVERVVNVPTQFDPIRPFADQVRALVDGIGLSPVDWQTQPLLIAPPSLNLIALALLAELHGRMGYFPSVVRLRAVPGSNPPRFEVAEIVNLQAVRDAARQRR